MSAAALGLEITLTNVFGVLLQYHYVAFVVSLAIFGIGAGAYVARSPGKGKDASEAAGWVCAAAGLYIALLSLFLAHFPYVNYLALYALLGAVPFGLFGWVMGKAFASGVMSARRVYAADLFGAGVGVAGAYGLLHLFGGLASMFAMSLLAFAGAIALFGLRGQSGGAGAKRRLVGAALSAAVLLGGGGAGLFAGPSAGWWSMDWSGMKGAAPDKTLIGALQNPGAVIERSTWDEFARTDIVATSDPARKMVFVDGGAGSYMYRFDGNLNSVAGLARDIEFLPFAVGSAGKAIVVGSGGGRDILYALLAGAKDVTAVELSEGIVRSMREDAAFNGGIMDRPGVRTIVGDGRGVLERSEERYDLIVLDLVYSQVGGRSGQALSENYVFTTEAFQTYLMRLNKGGRIIVISHHGLEGLRAYYTGFSALMAHTGGTAGEAAAHTALLMAPEGSASPNLTLSVIQNTPLANGQLELLRTGAQSLGLQPLFLPVSDEIFLKPLLEGKVGFDAFVRDSDYQVFPTTDDRPFFFQLDPGLPESLRTWLGVIVGLTVLFAAVVWWREAAPAPPADRRQRRRLGFGAFAYFTLLGIGYMCLQLALIQKAMVYVGSPVLATAVVLFAMLVGGGAGSRTAAAGSSGLTARTALAAAVVAAVLIGAAQLLWGDHLHALNTAYRLLVIGLSVFVLGFFLGVPMPVRLDKEERRQPGVSPLWFAVNGIAGIWGSCLAAALSLLAGLNWTLAAGCVCYIVLFIVRNKEEHTA